MSARLSSVFPRPSASDPDDVVWTLQTAAVQWQRGLRADAIVWVRKAADLSTQGGRTPRAEELRNHAARLAEFLWTDPQESADAPASARAAQPATGGRRVISAEDEDEIIEVEELDSYELEFTETDLPTPEDAATDISPEDLSYYQSGEEQEGAALPDDLDLRSDSELPESSRGQALRSDPPQRGDSTLLRDSEPLRDSELLGDSELPTSSADSFLSVNPEPEEEDDSFISVHPESDSEYLEVSPESIPAGISSLPAPQSDLPTQPRIERPPPFRRGRLPPGAEVPEARLPTLPSPAAEAAELELESVELESVEPGSLDPGSPEQRFETVPLASALLSAEVSPPETPPGVDGLAFESVEALADLPEDAQSELAACAQLITLTSSQEYLLREGTALITHGQVHVTLPYSDVSGERIGSGAVVAARGSVEAGPLRLIADAEQTRLATWTDAQLTRAMRDCPWVEDDLRQLADRLQAHASAGMGPLGERLDDALRAAVYERLTVRVLAPDESVAERGKPLKGLFVVAVGDLTVGANGSLGSGQFVFPSCVIGAELAPEDVRAGPKGSVVLYAARPVAHELMMSVPPLLEILAS